MGYLKLKSLKKIFLSFGILIASTGLAFSVMSIAKSQKGKRLKAELVEDYKEMQILEEQDPSKIPEIMELSDKEVLELAEQSKDPNVQRRVDEIKETKKEETAFRVAMVGANTAMVGAMAGVVVTKAKMGDFDK